MQARSQVVIKDCVDEDGDKYRQVFVYPPKRTLCASCEHMWDGFGEPCPREECRKHTTSCEHYERMSDEDLLSFAPQFWDETFVHHIISDEEAERLKVDVVFAWQPVRPLISEIQLSLPL